MNSIDIRPADLETVRRILREHVPDLEVHAFGSRVGWTARETSDLDLALMTDEPLSIDRTAGLRSAFTESDLPFRVDIVDWSTASESFRQRILKNHVVLTGQALEVDSSTKASRVGRDEGTDRKNWRNTNWGDLVTLEYGRALRRYGTGAGAFRVFGTNGPIGWHDEALVKCASVIVGRKGAYRGVHYSHAPCFVIDTAFYLKPKAQLDVRWAYYTLLTQDINGLDSGSAIPSTSREDFYGLPVSVPPLAEQRAIARILGALDDKIELNRRMNATLEALARALFRSWFVDFDPVRAKMEGRDTGLPKEIADLFPDRLVNSELGEIPNGWVPSRIDGVAAITKGRSYRRRELVASDTALVTLKSFARGGGYRPDGLKSFRGVYKPEQVVRPGEVVVACTDVTQAAEVVGRSAVVGEAAAFRTLVASLDVLIVRPTNSALGRTFMYYVTGTDDFVAHAIARTTGTTVLHLAKDAVASFRFALPPGALMERFEHLAGALHARIQSNLSAVGLLVELRDALLPKLVSGELRLTALELASVPDDRPAAVGTHAP